MQKIEKLNKDDVMLLLRWLKGEMLFTNSKRFNYDNLINECLIGNDDKIDVSNYIDNIMIELYPLYEKLINIGEKTIKERIEQNPYIKFLPVNMIDEVMKNYKRFLDLFEKLLINYKYENEELKQIQRKTLNELINKYIETEEYEKCLELKEKIKNI